ncbi:tetratricopeptide repeat protein [Burkholderia sp. Ac-20365]|uniref:tetratricopeptide repeat protein n=1 Tax=Burkholderia sp. Ac-20365 TaxID=2703897 RepID=UPI00197B85F0|nr:tetratricopeptide repeat protein [Burkholderia sp. Ac-20365]MBN3765577.1 tetratricopeptide repeat protein [Burkholderia sp. Ac-20365]
MPPDVLAACRGALISTGAGRFNEAVELSGQCLASPSLTVEMRAAMLFQRAVVETVLKHPDAALEAQEAAVALTAAPTDLQILMLAQFYDANHRYKEALDTLDRIQSAHEAKHEPNSALGMPYYLALAQALAGLGRHQDAIDAASKGLAIQSASADAYRLRAAEREAIGDKAGARDDYLSFARWATDQGIDTPMRAKLTALKIDPVSERRHPFGAANPLRELSTHALSDAQTSLKSATTPQEKAKAYGDISAYLDNSNRHQEALKAIDQAIALAPDDTALRQSKITTLIALNRLDDAIAQSVPLVAKMHGELEGATDKKAIYRKYTELTTSLAWAYILKGEPAKGIDLLADSAQGSAAFDQDYLATVYLYVRARSGGSAPANAYFDDYIRRNAQLIPGNYRRWLLLYMQGRVPIDMVYSQAVMIPVPEMLENALAETWFMAAAYERYVKHDDAASRVFVDRINDLQPYGTSEWGLVTRGAV